MVLKSKLIASKKVKCTATAPRIGFTTEGAGQWPAWDRFITLDGRKAFHIGNICGTCEFFFEKLEGANEKVSPKELSERLRIGLSGIDDDVVRAVTTVLPAGKYDALLLKCVPRAVVPSKPGDYFFEEQVGLWGIDEFWGVPHYTKTEYYRTPFRKIPNRQGILESLFPTSRKIPSQRGLFEFLIPMFPVNHLHVEEMRSYEDAFSQGAVPTALAISVLDVKQPADWEGEPDVTEHWCLSHYLLDGHHNVYTASKLAAPVSLLSFLAVEEGVSSRDQVAKLIATLGTE